MLIVNKFYKLKKTIKKEHQDCLFTYPKGLVLRLEKIRVEDELRPIFIRNEDGEYWDYEKIGTYNVFHFEIIKDGMCDIFAEEDVEPAAGFDLMKNIRSRIDYGVV